MTSPNEPASPTAPAPRPAIAVRADVGIPARGLVDLARRSEAAGLPGIYLLEMEYDAFPYLLGMALATASARVGTSVARMFTRHPLAMAETASALAALAPGRTVLGLGSGPPPAAGARGKTQSWGLPFASVALTVEYLEILTAALRGEEIQRTGDFYRVEGVRIDRQPAPPPAVYLAAGGPRLVEAAGRLADGVFLYLQSPARIAALRSVFLGAAAGAGRNPESLTVASLLMTCIDRDGQRAVEAMRRFMIDTYFQRPLNRRLLAAAGFEDVSREVTGYLDAGRPTLAARALPDEVIRAMTVCGDPCSAGKRLGEFVAAGLDETVLYVIPTEGDWERAYRTVITAAASGFG